MASINIPFYSYRTELGRFENVYKRKRIGIQVKRDITVVGKWPLVSQQLNVKPLVTT